MKSLPRHLPRIIGLFLVVGMLALALSPLACAATGSWQNNEQARARLVAGVTATGDLQDIPLGLEIDLEPGWHIYWRTPGEAGLPPSLDWSAAQNDGDNLGEATLLFPRPTRFTLLGIETLGYADHILLPVVAKPRHAGQPLILKAKLDLLACRDICVPNNFDLSLDLPPGPASLSAHADAVARARADVPKDDETIGLKALSATTESEQEKPVLVVALASDRPLTKPDILIEGADDLTFGPPSLTLAADKLSATARLTPTGFVKKGTTIAARNVTLTLLDGDRAREQKIALNAEPPPSSSAPPPLLGTLLLLALLGGLILNLMPCVLPVLSLKLLSVVSHGGSTSSAVRRSFLMTSAGILFSFLLLAVSVIALKTAGMAVGWGVQFQQPLFIVFLCVLLTIFAANMWGLVEIQMPLWLANRVNDKLYHPKLAGDFATGAFATLLATPCSAPFLGTAVGFALGAGIPEILAIFFALGLGLALPYLGIALVPKLATCLPKPGGWMIRLRHLLGIALAATVLWLLFVLAAQVSLSAVTITGLCLTGLVAAIATHRRSDAPAKPFLFAVMGILVAAAFYIPATSTQAAAEEKTAHATVWQAFDEARIPQLVAEGKTVFVDVTASWCLTCIANERFILNSDAVTHQLFGQKNVVTMRADWTNPNPAIAAYLRKYGRYGIPFNIVYGPNASQGIPLPELLTEKTVLNALSQAAATKPCITENAC